jgi:hypothetical protein
VSHNLNAARAYRTTLLGLFCFVLGLFMARTWLQFDLALQSIVWCGGYALAAAGLLWVLNSAYMIRTMERRHATGFAPAADMTSAPAATDVPNVGVL